MPSASRTWAANPARFVIVAPDLTAEGDRGQEGPGAPAAEVQLAFGKAITDTAPRLRVRADGQGRIIAVELTDPEGLSPTVLQRFPWARWLTVADGALQCRGTRFDPATPEHAALRSASARAEKARRPRKIAPNRKRPGRTGHPDSHYERVAKRYAELRLNGSLNPTATIAREGNVSRNTVAGWVRGARERGFLPPARGNRPG